MAKTKVFVMFDNQFSSWNVMTAEHKCLFFGTAKGVNGWLVENKDGYEEFPESEVMNSLLDKAA